MFPLRRAILIVCAFAVLACGGGADDEAAKGPTGPALGFGELPIGLRSGDQAPSGNYKVELAPGELRVDDKVILPLRDGNVPVEQFQNGVIGALKAALTGGRARIALHVHSALPYQTVALVLNTAADVGVRNASFQVRKHGAGPTDTGWMSVDNFAMTPRTDLEVKLAAVAPRPWSDFTSAWEDVYQACRGAKSGSCAYTQTNVATGGNLKIMLHASGHGVNVNFFRVGFSAEEIAMESAKRDAALSAKKRDFLDGRLKQTDLEKELLEGEPATQALFQFRSQEALTSPSALAATVRPLCGTSACGVVVSADPNTLMVRVLSMLGATFPDGTPAPVIAFEMPWTEKPKLPTVTVPPPEAAEVAAEGPAKAAKKKKK